MSDKKPDEGRVMFAFAHDLRGMLRTTLTRIQLVQAGGGAALPEQERQFLEEAAGAAAEMNRLLSAMVAYSDATRTAQTSDAGALSLILRGAVMEMKPAVRETGGEVFISGEIPDHQVPAVIRNVVKELISNAARFRKQERTPEIEVSARQEEDGILVSVADNGIGVESAWLERIFQPFHRIHSRSEYPGIGLGLATADRLVTALGGSISAAPSKDGGLQVNLKIPVSQQPVSG